MPSQRPNVNDILATSTVTSKLFTFDAAVGTGSRSQAKSEPPIPNIAPVRVVPKHVSLATKELGDDEQSASKKRTLKDFLDGDTQMSESKSSQSKQPNLTRAESTQSITAQKQSQSAGTARSSQHGQKQKEAIRNGTFVVDRCKQARWQTNILVIDPDAEFEDDNVRQVRHSKCGEKITVKVPYDTMRFKKHCQVSCNGPVSTTRFTTKLPARRAGAGMPTITKFLVSIPPVKAATTTTVKKSCPGLDEITYPQVAQYLDRTGAIGGGGSSVTIIALGRFGKPYTELSQRKKNEVKARQLRQHKWQNDTRHGCVHATDCLKDVNVDANTRATPCSNCYALLSDAGFKKAIKIPIPADKNYKFLNKEYLDQAAVDLYGRVTGLKELLDTASKVCLVPDSVSFQ